MHAGHAATPAPTFDEDSFFGRYQDYSVIKCLGSISDQAMVVQIRGRTFHTSGRKS